MSKRSRPTSSPKTMGWLAWAREVFRAEELDYVGPAHGASKGRSWLGWVLARETLEALPVQQAKGASWLGWVFSGETLEDLPERRRASRSWLGWVVSSETLEDWVEQGSSAKRPAKRGGQ